MSQYVMVEPKYVLAKREYCGFDFHQSPRVAYNKSHQLDLPVRLRLDTLDGADPDLCADVFARVQLYWHGEPLTPPTFTPHCVVRNAGQLPKWSEWIHFPLQYRDLPPDTLVCVTVYSPHVPSPHVLGGTSFHLFTSKGSLKRGFRRYLLHPLREADGAVESQTLGRIVNKDFESRLYDAAQEYALQTHLHITWLDKHTFRKINEVNKQQTDLRQVQYLTIEFPGFPTPVVFACPQRDLEPAPEHNNPNDTKLVLIKDPELHHENPAEAKDVGLAKSYHLFVDPDLQPTTLRDRKLLQQIISYPPIHDITAEETLMLWQYRYFLTKEKRAFVKFMKCVDWRSPKERSEAEKLLRKWDGIAIDDALELLGVTFRGVPALRECAVNTLLKVTDDELCSILLQVVQGIRYEDNPVQCDLVRFLLDRGSRSFEVANYLHWYLAVECDDEKSAATFRDVQHAFLAKLAQDGKKDFIQRLEAQKALLEGLNRLNDESRRKEKDRKRRITVARELVKDGAIFGPVFAVQQNTGGDNSASNSGNYIDNSHGHGHNRAVSLPLDPAIEVDGIGPSVHIFGSAKQPMLVELKLKGMNPEEKKDKAYVKVIFKSGDDLRQDQLVIQLFNLMDSLLKRNGLDLRLTPYRVLATSSSGGLVECVPDSQAMSAVHASTFLRDSNPDPEAPHGVKPEALQNYIKSCAGYCVITFLLGVGDRHLDNLMVTGDGRLFHIDFGFILGRDPKPFPPAMKITKEMVEAMGGEAEYHQFKSYCCSAYTILRKHASLILNLLVLMIDANIPDITGDYKKVDPKMNILKVQEKFRLDLNEADAIQYMQTVIHDSVTSVAGRLIDFFHKLANP